MKHALKVILPLVLVVALLAAACWFFLFYRTDLTMSVFAYWGEHYYEAGRYNRAISMYKLAAKLEPENDKLPVLLADAYVKDGNYTKAEYTLVSAITENPNSARLYLALSQTYVAQDKLLDAEQMLNRITNDDVKREIDAMRPAAPVIEPESGYYSEYIEVSVTSADPVYMVLNADYPSMTCDAYTGPVTLSGGESKIVAVAVGDNGLVSDASYAGYTVGSVVEPVTIQDAALDTYVRELLGKSPGATIMSDELWDIRELTLPEGVQSLDDLKLFAGLTSLAIHDTTMDVSVLGELTTLKSLDLSGCTLSSAALETIGTLPELQALNLSGCAVSSINALVGLSNLTSLDLTNNTISDITALSALTQLTELHLTNNPVRTITYLNNCLALEKLYMENCGVSRLSSIAGNTAIRELYASNNSITDISVLAGCTSLSVIDVSGNQITDISVLTELPALTGFYADNNLIETVPVFDAGTCKLVNFSINHNAVADISGLAGLQWLNYVHADYNKITDVTCLGGCWNLIQIDVWDNPLDTESIPELQEIGIIVNYNPTYEPPAEEPEES